MPLPSGARPSRRVPDPLSRGDKLRLTRLRKFLLGWYADHGRSLPWRSENATAFERVCVEVLLQRTRAETVARVYPVFFGRFASWDDIAETPVEELEEHFKPIGLWQRRARSVKALAGWVTSHGGEFPATPEGLAEVPAVGQYVANAILLFHHGQHRPLLDVNMARLVERYVRPRRLADIRYDPWLQEAAAWLVRGDDPVTTNWATLDFASAVCLARTPRCGSCPLSWTCPASLA